MSSIAGLAVFVCYACSTFFLMGPWNQLKRMFAETRIIATIIVLVRIIVANHSLLVLCILARLKAEKVISRPAGVSTFK